MLDGKVLNCGFFFLNKYGSLSGFCSEKLAVSIAIICIFDLFVEFVLPTSFDLCSFHTW